MKQTFSPSKSQIDRFEAFVKLGVDFSENSLRLRYGELIKGDSKSFDRWLDNVEKELEEEKEKQKKHYEKLWKTK